MNHFAITPKELAYLTQQANIIKRTTTLDPSTYSYMISRMLEAAMRGETRITIPSTGFSNIEIAKVSEVFNAFPNGIRMYLNEESNEIQMFWTEY